LHHQAAGFLFARSLELSSANVAAGISRRPFSFLFAEDSFRGGRFFAATQDSRSSNFVPATFLPTPQMSTIIPPPVLAGAFQEIAMYHYDAATALEELQEDALLPHPVKLRDMILRHQLGVEDAKSINHQFQDYLARFGESQKIARGILEKLATSTRKPA
jgi:hypothetical protein